MHGHCFILKLVSCQLISDYSEALVLTLQSLLPLLWKEGLVEMTGSGISP